MKHTNTAPARPRILVIDDVPLNLQVLSAALGADYEVLTAQSGAQGLEIAQWAIPDLIILDVMMPGMDGYETCRQLKQSRTLSAIPFIFLTGLDDARSEELGLDLGAMDYITKPFNVVHTRLRVRNVLAHHWIERTARLQQEQFRITLDAIADAVIATDKDGNINYLNPVAENLTGWMSSEANGQPVDVVFQIFLESSDQKTALSRTQILRERGRLRQDPDTLLLSRNGSVFHVEDTASAIRNGEGEAVGTVIVFHDVTEQRRLAGEVSYQATHDQLTGLINRSEFEARLQRSLLSAQQDGNQHILLHIDLDQFKLVNDACGHAVGDRLLQQVTGLIEGCMRAADTLARTGGDEFAVILNQCNEESGMRIAMSICERLDEFRFFHQERRFRIGASIGLVLINADSTSISDLLLAADTACLSAKDGGRNRVHRYVALDARVTHHRGEVNWAARIEEALEQNQFVLFAQRITPLQHEGGLHCEILLRMQESDGKLTPPGAFLSAAERYHMASRIDRWVIRAVLDILENHGPLHGVEQVAINLSGQSIGDREFHRHVEQLLLERKLDYSKLCFEITETSAISGIDDAVEFINKMRGYGVRFSLDDFGSGVSSFGYLKTLPVDYLKIDGQFVKNMATDKVDFMTVRCVADLGRSLGKLTIAEFVETEAVHAALLEMGIDYVQGYLIHKPEAFTEVLKSSSIVAL